MKYVIGRMNNQGQPQVGGCAGKIVREAAKAAAADQLRISVCDAAKSDTFNQFKENWNKAWQEQADPNYMDLQLRYPNVQPMAVSIILQIVYYFPYWVIFKVILPAS